MEKTGKKIYNLRKQKGVSQEELAFEVGVARQTVSKWETGAMRPSIENVKCLCEFFGVESSYFFDNGEETAVTQNVPLPESSIKTRFKTLKILSVVAGLVLLAIFIVACSIAAYITIAEADTHTTEYTYTFNHIDLDGIILLVLGAVAAAVFIVLITLITIKKKKKRRREK